MFEKRYLFIVFLIIFVAVSYLLLNNKATFFEKNDLSLKTFDTNENQNSSFSIVLGSGQNTQDTGIAVFARKDNKTQVSVKMLNFGGGQENQINLYLGTCQDLKTPKYTLSPLLSGSSETTLNIDFNEFFKTLPLLLVVGNADLGEIISCSQVEVK